ncbi:hypothetical protein P700755_001076 [Psychroflexus torquis ATCC 700755]|uniref:Heavy-metal-associated domain-containing protein n=1 Tax=Psychroflexus torquis (strain ATCC 700755 / CIP 106069 / ACAM 623) TaxID=313595 RepID=K4IRG3_PSYTT|nr:heavy metal-associated domain-containing protein [Psychroflexus torquis]AFU68045.1 hypothetical protein P700755_001076 [Psychroflexus torquis ATCC 700755]
MSLLSDNIIPGNRGKYFETNATSRNDIAKIKEAVLKVPGIKDVIMNEDKFPREFKIHTSSMVAVKDIEDAVLKIGFHAISKSLFEL